MLPQQQRSAKESIDVRAAARRIAQKAIDDGLAMLTDQNGTVRAARNPFNGGSIVGSTPDKQVAYLESQLAILAANDKQAINAISLLRNQLIRNGHAVVDSFSDDEVVRYVLEISDCFIIEDVT